MPETASVLNLDEFYGIARNPKVRWQEKEYDLLLPDALGPAAFLKYERLRQKFRDAADQSKTAQDDKEIEKAASTLEACIRDLLRFLAPDFPVDEVAFTACVKILTWYNEQAALALVGQGKAASQPTGARSLRGWLSGMASGSKRRAARRQPPSGPI